jgi:dipeptidyl-peptidase 4
MSEQLSTKQIAIPQNEFFIIPAQFALKTHLRSLIGIIIIAPSHVISLWSRAPSALRSICLHLPHHRARHTLSQPSSLPSLRYTAAMLPAFVRRPHPAVGLLVCVSTFCIHTSAQTPALHPSESFRQHMTALLNGDYSSKHPEPFQWLDGGKRYTLLEPVAAPAKGEELVSYDTGSGGGRTVLVPAAAFIPKGATEPLDVEDYDWSSDHTRLLLFTNSRKVWRENTRGDYWVLDLQTHTLSQLGGSAAAPSSLMFAKFSPDGGTVAYVRENNLYAEDLATHTVRALTTDGSADIINGTSDWVNEEELDIRDAFRWSPDSRSIAFWNFDQSGVQEWTLIDDTSGPVPVTRRYHYPQVGTTNSATHIGVINLDQPSKVTWLKLPGDPREHYVPHMDWVPHTRQIAAEYLDRPQRDDSIYIADAETGDTRLIFEDTDSKTYVDTIGFHGLDVDFTWLPSQGKPDGAPAALLWFSERDGWRHAYAIPLSATPAQPKLLTDFAADIIDPVALDPVGGWLFFTASPGDPIRSYLYRVSLTASATPTRLTPSGETGTHAFSSAAPDGLYAIESFSNANTAPRFTLTRLADSHPVRTLAESPAITAKVAALDTPIEFTDTAIGNGVSLSTLLIKPPHFDPTKKYPVLTYIYGEPADQTVVDRFSSLYTTLCFIAREGYIVLSFDNQGTPAPRGRDWRHAGYGAIGVLSTQQQAEAIHSFAASHPFIDTSRMAMWGWSGGGTNTLNMMFRNPGLYSTGISIAPVADQKRYDTIYQERYMGVPSTNARGYQQGSAINFAQGLTGNLLIIHGSGDDNVHMAGTEVLINRLITLGKTFDFMDYPGRTHSISEGEGTYLNVIMRTVRYLEDHVPAGAR